MVHPNRLRWLFAVCAVCFLGIAACDNNPAKDKPKAELGEPASKAAPAAAPPAGATATYKFSPQDSKIAFVGSKVTGKHDGGFGSFTGTVALVDNDPLKSTVKVEIDSDSITADNPKLTGHLKSADFFDTAKFPKVRFASTSIRPRSEKGTHDVTGNLELHGVTKTITFPATLRTTPEQVDVDAEFAINRKDFGIVYPGMPDDLIKDDVLIRLTVRSKKSQS
jgi:polyisoprenoid-binding protein YceI